MGTWTKQLGWLVAWFALPVVLYLISRGIIAAWAGHKMDRSMDQWLMGNILTTGASFWLWIFIWGLVGCFIAGRIAISDGEPTGAVLTIVCVALTVSSLVLTIVIGVNNDKSFQRYYARSVVFYTPSLNPQKAPQSIATLIKLDKPGDGKHCDLVADKADVPSCIKQGVLPTTGWDARVSSFFGAKQALRNQSQVRQNVSLNDQTVEYLNTWHGQPARWSGVLDGTNNGTPMGGVAEWDGHKVRECDFDGRYNINRAFDGSGKNDLPDLLAQKYPSLLWNIWDVWGYCQGNEPIVIVPVTEQSDWENRTVSAPAGIIRIEGDHGQVKLTYQADVRPGEYPGPVYPSSMVDTQSTAAEWAAGRQNHDRNGFGYEPTNAAVQAGNASDYLLRNKATGRLEWVTPVTLRSSSSQEFVAYEIAPADQVNTGSLNQLSIYVLAPNDPRVISLQTMESRVNAFFSQQNPGFYSSHGKLLEFTPVGGNIWRAYGEINNQVQFLLDIDATNPSTAQVTNLGGSTDTTGGSQGADANQMCGKTLSTLSPSQLTNCLKLFADELAARQGNTSVTK